MSQGFARARTIAHMRRLLTGAALTACSSHEQAEPAAVTLPSPPPAASTAPAPTRTVARTATPAPTGTATVTPTATATVVRRPMHGYDPVGPPPQLYCRAVASGAHATASLRRRPHGIFEIKVHLTLASSGPSQAIFPPTRPPSSPVQAYGAVVLSSSFSSTSGVVRIRPTSSASGVYTMFFFVQLQCGGGGGSLRVQLKLDPKNGKVRVDHMESR